MKVSKKNKNNDHDRVSHGVKCNQEGDHTPPLESNGPKYVYLFITIIIISTSIIINASLYAHN